MLGGPSRREGLKGHAQRIRLRDRDIHFLKAEDAARRILQFSSAQRPAFQPRRLMIAPGAAGCKRLLDVRLSPADAEP
jgi:hypothetical protein